MSRSFVLAGYLSLALAAGGCLDQEAWEGVDQGEITETVPNAPESVVESADLKLPSTIPPEILTQKAATAPGLCQSVLVYDHNSRSQTALSAVAGLGLTHTRGTSGDFTSLLGSQAWDLVIMDLPSNLPQGNWQSALEGHIASGGAAIHSHWQSSSLTAGLQGAFEISNPIAHQTQSFYQWDGDPLFSTPNEISGAFDVWQDRWGTNGFRLTPTGSAYAAAGFTSNPSAGEAAIVIGNDGATIFNGFLFDDFAAADKDADSTSDMVELLQNQIMAICGEPLCPAGDTLIGTDGDDALSGGDGSDTIRGGLGSDHLHGGACNDELFGEEGNDELDGDDGDDLMDGGPGDDELDGEAGNDTMHGGPDNDELDGDDGDDILYGDDGDDELDGDDGNDELYGGEGDDNLDGDAGDDIVDGGAGSDWMHGADGNDQLSGGGADDVLIGDRGDDTIDGGAGDDRAYYTGDESEYIITSNSDGSITIQDTIPDRDGTDILYNVEDIRFNSSLPWTY